MQCLHAVMLSAPGRAVGYIHHDLAFYQVGGVFEGGPPSPPNQGASDFYGIVIVSNMLSIDAHLHKIVTGLSGATFDVMLFWRLEGTRRVFETLLCLDLAYPSACARIA